MGIGESRATKVQLLSLKKGTFQNQPPVGESYLIKDSDGVLKEFKDDGTKNPLGSQALTYAAARLVRAQTLLGPTVTSIYSTDFLPDSSFNVTGGGGSTAAVNADSAGIVALDTGVSAGTNSIAFCAAAKVVIGVPSTARWYVHSRTRFIGPIDATVILGIELCAPGTFGNPIIRLGVTGSISTTNWSFLVTSAAGATNASGTLTIAADLLVYHDFEMWSDGTTVSFAVDSVIGATTPAINIGVGGVMPMVRLNNGSAASSRTAKSDTLAAAVDRPAS